LFAVFLTGKAAKTLSVGVAEYVTERSIEWGPMSAMDVAMIILLLCVLPLCKNIL